MDNLDLYQERVADSRKILKSKLVDNKIKTFQKALDRSYNAETVSMGWNSFQALITGISTSPQIARKSFATLKENGCAVGDEIYWEANDSHWLISEHDSTENAIFQGSIQKAIYELKWKDPVSGKVYSARACAKGPDETTISDGVKHSIMFDRLTDSLYLIVSAKAEGSELLKRYFELMVNNRKWRIEVLNDITHPDLLYMQLIEIPVNRDTDTEDLVGGKTPPEFNIISSLDGISETLINTETTFKPLIYKDGILLKDENYTVRVRNSTLKDDIVTFDRIGKALITVSFTDLEQSKSWEVNISQELTNPESIIRTVILGDETVKTLMETEFNFIYSIDSVKQEGIGNWIYDDKYFEVIFEDQNDLKLKAKNKTGKTQIKYQIDTDIFVKEIKVVPLFGGS